MARATASDQPAYFVGIGGRLIRLAGTTDDLLLGEPGGAVLVGGTAAERHVTDGPDTTGTDDGSNNARTGGVGRDGFFAHLGVGVHDKITDLALAEFAGDFDFLLTP
jgi:hypothetical protein